MIDIVAPLVDPGAWFWAAAAGVVLWTTVKFIQACE